MSLSNRQSARLGTILAAMSSAPIPEPYLSEAIAEGLISRLYNGNIILTDKGLNEKNRLCTLAGLNIQYLSEKNGLG